MMRVLYFIYIVILCNPYVYGRLESVRKVAVIGGGTGGLAFATALGRMGTGVEECKVFEKRASVKQAALGGGVQLSGGASILYRLGLGDELASTGERLMRVVSRNSNNSGLLRLDIDKLIRERAGDVLCDDNGEALTFSIMRDALQELLHRAACDEKAKTDVKVEINKTCDRIIRQDNDKLTLIFADGTEDGDWDMVVGADGLNSVVRSHTSSQNKPILPIPALEPGIHYTGIRITFAVTDEDPDFVLRNPEGRGAFHQWFGDGCYALTASYGGLKGVQHMMALVRRDHKDAALQENPEWKEESIVGNLKQLTRSRLEQAGFAGNKELLDLVDNCNSERFIDIGVKDRSLPLKSWSSLSGRVVLLGDSAHAMAPFLGQGANQAIQDAYSLSRQIGLYNSQYEGVAGKGTTDSEPTASLYSFIKTYENERKPSTALLSVKSNFLGFVETLGGTVGSLFRDNFFRMMGYVGVAAYIFLDGAKPRVGDLDDYRKQS